MAASNKHGRKFERLYNHFGQDTYGTDLKVFGDTTGKYFMWDASADSLLVSGTLDVTGTLDADAFTVGGVAGVDHGPADITSITVVKGIVTAVTSV